MAETVTTIQQPWEPLGAGIKTAVQMGSDIVGKTPPTSALGLPQQAGVDPFSQQAQELAKSQLGLGAFTRDPTTGAVTNIAAGGTGITGYAPYLTGTGTQAGAATLTGPGAGSGLGSIESYMSPYTAAMKTSALKAFDDQRDIDQQRLGYDAIKAGAFGGGRHGLTEANFLAKALKDKTQLGAGYDQAAFLNAQKARTTDQAGLMDLAKQIQTMGGVDIAQLGNLGQAGQMYGQAGLDTTGQAAKQQWSEPMDRVNWYSNLLAGLGGGLGQSSPYGTHGPEQFQPSPGMAAAQSGLGGSQMLDYLSRIWNV